MRYVVDKVLSSSKSYCVLEVYDELSRAGPFVLKGATKRRRTCQILNEQAVLPALQGIDIVPELICVGCTTNNLPVVVTNALGTSLMKNIDTLDMRTLVRHARRLTDGLEQIHARGYVHGDVKPQHLVVKSDRVILIDYGLCGKINEPVKGWTEDFACPNALKGQLLHPAQDLCALQKTLDVCARRLPSSLESKHVDDQKTRGRKRERNSILRNFCSSKHLCSCSHNKFI